MAEATIDDSSADPASLFYNSEDKADDTPEILSANGICISRCQSTFICSVSYQIGVTEYCISCSGRLNAIISPLA